MTMTTKTDSERLPTSWTSLSTLPAMLPLGSPSFVMRPEPHPPGWCRGKASAIGKSLIQLAVDCEIAKLHR